MDEFIMAAIKFDDQSIRCITIFENITNTQVKDCIEREDTIYFIVSPGQLLLAIGKNGSKIRRLRGLFHKNIKVIEYSPKTETFIRNIFHEFPIKDIRIEESKDKKNKIAFVSVDIRDKGKIIGRDSKNLKLAKEILNRHNKMDILIV